MEKKLYKAAKEGRVSSLISLLREDELILDGCTLTSSFQDTTPPHIAAMLGHKEFCFELLHRKPELAGELDSRRLSPLHLASARGDTEIAKALANVNPPMCFVYDTDERNPLHIAAIRGKVAVLKELAQVQPDAAQARSNRGETILHLCVQYFQVEALKLLINIGAIMDDKEFVNAKDNNGNTILHLAVAEKQREKNEHNWFLNPFLFVNLLTHKQKYLQVIKFLLHNTAIEINSQNAFGFTEMNILTQIRRDAKDLDIVEFLQDAGAQKSKQRESLSRKPRKPDSPNTIILRGKKSNRLPSLRKNTREKYLNKRETWLGEQRDSLMVVASLIETMAFQAGLNPPCGVWQETSSINDGHKVGQSIMGNRYPNAYRLYIPFHTSAFISSVSVILLLISGLPLKRRVFMWVLAVIMWAAVTSIAIVYVISLAAIIPENVSSVWTSTIAILTMAWPGLMAILFLLHIVRFLIFLVKKMKKFLRSLTKRQSNVSEFSV